DDLGVGIDTDEAEATAQRVVDQGDAAIDGIHGPDHDQVGGHDQLAAEGEGHRLAAVFERVEQLAEDPRRVTAIDLVDDEYVEIVRILAGRLGDTEERALGLLVAQRGLFDVRAQALDEVLVGVAGVELNQAEAAV